MNVTSTFCVPAAGKTATCFWVLPLFLDSFQTFWLPCVEDASWQSGGFTTNTQWHHFICWTALFFTCSLHLPDHFWQCFMFLYVYTESILRGLTVDATLHKPYFNVIFTQLVFLYISSIFSYHFFVKDISHLFSIDAKLWNSCWSNNGTITVLSCM